MRLWSIHPRYLDCQGLLALWREGLLAQKVLLHKTKGYTKHPQLERFKKHPRPIAAIGSYLYEVYREGKKRNYNFQKAKINIIPRHIDAIKVSWGQLRYEYKHLMKKLKTRDSKRYKQYTGLQRICPHPLYRVVAGPKASWEK